ncbi:hypothetical protein LV779_31025 [Streptomyces thinghirensis]|nr:hypothetical protein [Streptomyces thinghirensis]
MIRELLTHRYRVVAPPYGYDAAPVLAHALAAHNLRRNQLIALWTGTAVIALLLATGLLNGVSAALLVFWLAWATMFLRRLAILQTLAEHLAPPADDRRGFDGGCPTTSRLTPELVGKIDREQASDTVYYGGYKPFVGAGHSIRRCGPTRSCSSAPRCPATARSARACSTGTSPPSTARRTAPATVGRSSANRSSRSPSRTSPAASATGCSRNCVTDPPPATVSSCSPSTGAGSPRPSGRPRATTPSPRSSTRPTPGH